jgi:ADP-ribosylglycohydrolase
MTTMTHNTNASVATAVAVAAVVRVGQAAEDCAGEGSMASDGC